MAISARTTGHNYIGHSYIGHNYMGHTYIGHNYVDRNYTISRATDGGFGQLLSCAQLDSLTYGIPKSGCNQGGILVMAY